MFGLVFKRFNYTQQLRRNHHKECSPFEKKDGEKSAKVHASSFFSEIYSRYTSVQDHRFWRTEDPKYDIQV